MNTGAPTPLNEAARLCRINDLGLLDGTPDEMLDQIVVMAAEYFSVPIALVSIVAENRQWFSASSGISARETSRDMSFCAYAILSDGLFQIPDARLDERFRDNPLVTGKPFIRFYAAAPLVTADGLGLGSLCIIDDQPRARLSERDATMLEHFAKLVMQRLTCLRKTSYLDHQTGLFNRTRLEQDLPQRVALQDQALVVIDVIAPQMLNDIVRALGYSFAQSLMGLVNQALHEQLPPGVELYKIGPTRFGFFCALQQATDPAVFMAVLQRFRQPLLCRNIPLHLQVGIGAIGLQDNRDSGKDWLRLVVSAADQARHHRLGWHWYEPQMDLKHQRAFLLLASLADAVHAPDQLSLVYQPRVDLVNGRPSSVEALLRWQHPVLGPVSPAEFIPLAEKTALIRTLSLWVLRNVVAQALQWRQQGLDLRVAINVSAQDLGSPAFTDELLNLLTQSGLDPRSFEVEFTESALSDNPDIVRSQLHRLRRAGLEVAIDDFGTGYSNWTYLRQLPATSVKIDKSLIDDMLVDDNGRRLVEAIVNLSCRMGYRVVAEGVETPEVHAALRAMGCHEVQGFLIARPMAPQALEEWLGQPAVRLLGLCPQTGRP